LESYGIRSLGNAWFESYLSNRFQCVEITHSENSNSSQNTYSSKLRKLQWGVPQGSVLGPFLFLLYIDLITFIKDVKIILYADDISILVTDKRKENLNIKVTKVMKQLEEWFDKNQLILNIHKSSVISFHTRQRCSFVKPKIMYNNMEFTYCSQLKFLVSRQPNVFHPTCYYFNNQPTQTVQHHAKANIMHPQLSPTRTGH
jgi:hypothetical protein